MSALAKALVTAQSQMPRLHKDAEANTGAFRYKYLSLDTLLAEVLPVLNGQGLALWQGPCLKDKVPALRTVLLHEGGETIETTMPLAVALDASAQAQGSAISYARRYSILSMLALAPDEDDDGAAAQKAPAKAQEAATGPSQRQHARLNALLDKLEEKSPKGEGQKPYKEDARDWIKAKFGKHSRAQLTVSEMGDLIDEVERWSEMADIPFSSEPVNA